MRRRFLMVLSIAALVAFAAAPASAQTFTLTATLSGSNETPAAINTGAFGSCTVTVDLTARTVSWIVDVFNLPSGVTASHIHVGGPGTSGPVVITFNPVTNTSNDFRFTGSAKDTEFTLRPDQGIRSADDMFQALLGNNTYCNVHSQVNGGGEIRGPLIVKQ